MIADFPMISHYTRDLEVCISHEKAKLKIFLAGWAIAPDMCRNSRHKEMAWKAH
jgi:hypothetical protein